MSIKSGGNISEAIDRLTRLPVFEVIYGEGGASDDVREMERLHTRQIWVYTMEERERHFVTCWLTVCCSLTLALSW